MEASNMDFRRCGSGDLALFPLERMTEEATKRYRILLKSYVGSVSSASPVLDPAPFSAQGSAAWVDLSNLPDLLPELGYRRL
jgi:hypothetical protein